MLGLAKELAAVSVFGSVALFACGKESGGDDGGKGGSGAGTTAGTAGSTAASGGSGSGGRAGSDGQGGSAAAASGGSMTGGTSATGGRAGAGAGGAEAGAGGSAGMPDDTGGRGVIDPTSGCRLEHVVAPEGVQAFVARDLDADGEVDLALWGYSLFPPADYGIAWGAAAGFSSPTWVELEVVGDFVGYGDFDGDDHGDLLVVGPRSGGTNNEYGALVLGGEGARAFEPGAYTRGGVGSAVGDFDGDGILDLFTALTDRFGVSKGVGDGTFEAYLNKYDVPSHLYSNGGNGTFVGLGDFDENGTLDVVVPLYSMSGIGELEVLLVDEVGDFSVGDRKTVSVGRPIVADFDGDGHADVAATTARDDEVHVWLGDGTGALELVTGLLPATGESPNYGASGDLDGDGSADIATYNYDSEDVSVLLGNGDGTFQPERRLTPRRAGAFNLGVADIDGDDVDDIVYPTLDGIDVYYGPCPMP